MNQLLLNSHKWLFGLSLIGISLLGCGTSLTPNPLEAKASDSSDCSSSDSESVADAGAASDESTEPEQGAVAIPKTATPPDMGATEGDENNKIPPSKSTVSRPSNGTASADETTTKVHPREIVRREKRGSLPFMVRECGYRFDYVYADDLDRFMKAAIEPAQTGSLEGRFKIATTVHRIPTSDQARTKADAFRLRSQFGNNGKADAAEKEDRIDDDEIAIQMALPFRLYKAESVDRERSKGVKGVQSVLVNRADASVAWFLTENERLARCRTPQEAQMIVARGGSLFFGEGRRTMLIFRGLDSNPHASELRNIPYNNFDPKAQAPQDIVAEIEVERLTYGPALDWQDSWGYYRHGALIAEEMDSDFVLQWNRTGVLTGMTPDYFRPTDSANPMVVSAHLVSAVLRTIKGEVIASYESEQEGAQLKQGKKAKEPNKEPQDTPAPDDADSVKRFLGKDPVCREVLERRSLADFLKEYPTAKKDNMQSVPAIKYAVYRESTYMYEFLDDKLFAVRFLVPRSFKSADEWTAPYHKSLGQPTNMTMPKDFREMKATKFVSWDLPKHNVRINFAHLPASLQEADLDLFGQVINLDAALEYLGRKGL